jgi:hypothetical protein
MLRTAHAAAAALLAAPAVAIASVIIQPTLSDDPAQQLSALTDHRSAAIAALALNTISIGLLIAGVIWIALALSPRNPRLALTGGTLGVLGALIVLFENGIAAAAPSIIRGLDPPTATAALDGVHSSAAASGLEPLSLLGDIGLALLGVAVLRAGAPRATTALIAAGALGEGIGFATATRALVLASFAILLVGLAQAVRTLIANPTAASNHTGQDLPGAGRSRTRPWAANAEAQRST